MRSNVGCVKASSGIVRTAAAVAALLAAASASLGQCTPFWDNVFASPGVIGNGVNAVCTWDDGTGPAVYIAGDFSTIGNIFTSGFPVPNLTGAHSIVKLTPTGYQTLDLGIGPISASQVSGLGNPRVVRDLVSYDPDGTGPAPSMLYAAGAFRYASTPGTGVTVERWNIAAWNGSSWSRVGPEFAPGLAVGDLSVGDPIRFNVRTMAVYDADGPGPQNPELYVGGAFPAAGGVSAQGIARWNGTQWADVGGPFSSSDNVVYSLAVVDEDTAAGPLPPVLYAAGRLTAMGDGTGVTGLARWNGVSWSAVPGVEPAEPENPDIDGITALAVQRVAGGEVLWVGGNLLVNGQPCGVTRLVNGAWECVFTDGDARGGTIADGLFSLPMTVQRIAQFGDNMYFFGPPGGPSRTPCPAGSFLGGMYRWNAATGMTGWIGDIDALTHTLGALGTGDSLNVGVMTPIDLDLGGPEGERLFIGGNFNVIGGVPRTDMCAYNGSTFEAIHRHASVANGLVSSFGGRGSGGFLTTFDLDGSGPARESLIVAGSFHAAGEIVSPNVIAFDGAGYQAMPIGASAAFCDGVDFNGAPAFLDFAEFDDGSGLALYAASNNGVLRWSGSAWEKLAGSGGLTRRLKVFDDGGGSALWVISSTGSAKWNGSAWIDTTSGLGVGTPPTNLFCEVMGVFDFGSGPRLFATGTDFTNDDALGEAYFDVYEGGEWVAFVGNPTYGNIQGGFSDSIVFQGQLFLNGGVTQINGVPATAKIIGWNGSAWFDTGAFPGGNSFRLVVHDDGTGPALYTSSLSSTGSIYKWDGASTWTLVPGSLTPNINDIASFDDGTGPALYVAHASFVTNGIQSVGLSRYKTPCTSCPADFNNIGGVTVQDIFDFLSAWFAGEPAADFNHAGGVTVQDIFDFLSAWFAGCP